ncbi:MAG: metallophosphoesterase [Eubacteriaceae bacterium]|nr:metallophosphoesterase [Eubacteriaceae bacterium]MDD4508620.1 metallophosphoesterase [Eubacteriaceae bacterium]
MTVQTNAHVQDIGWMDWRSNGAVSGTTGKSKHLEAVELTLTGANASQYDIYYRVHSANYGWLDWAKNGQTAGTTGGDLQAEAIQIVIVNRGDPAPGSTETPYVLCNPNIQLDTATINVSGLKRDYKFLFISDTHIVNIAGNDSSESKAVAIPRYGLFTSRTGIHSAQLFPYYVQRANDNQVDALLMGGDIIDYPSDANITTLRNGLGKLNTSYLYTVGNHDWTYLWDKNDETTRQRYLPKLSEFTGGNSSFHTLEYDDLIVAALDDSAGQFTKAAADGLEACVQKGKPIVILIHIPFANPALNLASAQVWGSALTIGPGGIIPNGNSQRVLNMVTAPDSPIVAVLGAHLHFRYTNATGGKSVQMIGEASFLGRGILVTLHKQ